MHATLNFFNKKSYNKCIKLLYLDDVLIFSYTELVKLLLQSGAAVDYRPDTGEEFPRTTLCDEPLRLAIRNKHYVSYYTKALRTLNRSLNHLDGNGRL